MALQCNNFVRLTICALGICVCYMYYGMVQESLFSRQKIGPSFVLLIQCFTNTIVAKAWQTLQQVQLSAVASGASSGLTRQQQRLHHPLLALTALCYVSAMVCSNEALHYVSYPTAVLAKSCKLIPTMTMGLLIEHKQYQVVEWLAALCITLGIIIFNLSRMKQRTDDNEEDDDDSSTRGLVLLSISLLMDGFLGSFQGLLKQKTTMSAFWSLSKTTTTTIHRDDERKEKLLRVRAPTAVETMLYVNLYAMMYLIPLTIYNQQMVDGVAMLQGTISSSMDHDHHTNTTEEDRKDAHQTLLYGMVVLNMTVAIGQIFIFLTITWFSSLVCTTITTTRKFFTILLSIVYFGHHFTIQQWMATGLVFTGLYLGIFGNRLQQALLPPRGGGGSTTRGKHQQQPTSTIRSKEQEQDLMTSRNGKKVNTRVNDFNFSTTHFNFNNEEDIKED